MPVTIDCVICKKVIRFSTVYWYFMDDICTKLLVITGIVSGTMRFHLGLPYYLSEPNVVFTLNSDSSEVQ